MRLLLYRLKQRKLRRNSFSGNIIRIFTYGRDGLVDAWLRNRGQPGFANAGAGR